MTDKDTENLQKEIINAQERAEWLQSPLAKTMQASLLSEAGLAMENMMFELFEVADNDLSKVVAHASRLRITMNMLNELYGLDKRVDILRGILEEKQK